MGTETVPSQSQGLIRQDERISTDTLQAKGAGATDSSYTQAGPRPGGAVAAQDTHLTLATSGTQSEDGHLKVRTLRAGHPGPSGRGRMGWRDMDAGDGSDDYKGWDPYCTVTGFDYLYASVAADPVLVPHVIRLQSGELLVCGIETQGANPNHVYKYDPTTAAWTGYEVTAASDIVATVVASTIVQLDSGRVVLYMARSDDQVDAFHSDDDGETWDLYSARVLDTPCAQTITEVRAACDGDEVLLLVGYAKAGPTYTFDQHGSDDQGQSFVMVMEDYHTATANTAWHVNVVAKPGGGFIVGYNADVRHVDSAFSDVTDQEEIDIDGVDGAFFLTIWMDEDGTWYSLAGEAIFGGVWPGATLTTSHDGGYTWEDSRTTSWWYGTNTEYELSGSCCSTGGRAFFVTHFESSVTAYHQETVAVLELGGFSRHTHPASWEATEFDDRDYLHWRGDWTYAGILWTAIEEPGNIGAIWAVGGLGTDTLGSTGEMNVNTALAQQRNYTRTEAEDPDAINVEFHVRVDTGDGALGSDDIAVRIIHSDAAAYERDISLRISDTAYRLWDNVAGAQIGSDESVDFTQETMVRITMSKGAGGVDKVKTFWAHKAHVREFAEGPGGDATDTGGPYATNNTYEWGHLANAANDSWWSLFGYNNWCTRYNERATHNPGTAWTNPTHIHGKSWPTLPALIFDGVKIQATSGPSHIGETQDIEADYDYPIAAVFPNTHPSPQRTWRSTAHNVDVALVFDLESSFSNTRFDSSTLGLALFNTNVREAKLQRWTGAAWTDVVALNGAAGFTSLAYTRDGRKLHPDTGQTTQASQWLWYNAARGAQWDMGAGADAARYKRIEANTSGSWVGSGGTTKRPMLTIAQDTINGAEAASGLSGRLSMPNHLGTVHEYTNNPDYYRIYIPAQKTAEGYYEIGTIVVGDVLVFGRAYDWERPTTAQHNVEVIERKDGTDYARKHGPTRREFGFAWMRTAVDESQAWETDPSPDYIAGSAGGEAIATPADTLRAITGWLEREEGAKGVGVLLLQLSAGTGSKLLNDAELFAIGRIHTHPTRENVQGEEGDTELARLNEIIFRELPHE